VRLPDAMDPEEGTNPETPASAVPTTKRRTMDDDAIRTIVTRLSRPHSSGGEVIERAAILAEGADFAAVVEWILAHDGEPETRAPSVAGRGLHSSRLSDGAGAEPRTPLRFVLPAGALALRPPRHP